MTMIRPASFQVSDIIEWYRKKDLVVNRRFQRGKVWSSAAKTYLIDTILHGLPIPKVYFRTSVDPTTQTAKREIVDGQQRVTAIVEFANDEFRLTARSHDFRGLKYSDLPEDCQASFLAYTVTTDQLMNASDNDVIDIFARLNSYTVALNRDELRHAKYQTAFKFAVREAASNWGPVWEEQGVLTTHQRVRMRDDRLMAELFGVLVNGVTDGGAPKLDALYGQQTDDVFTDEAHKRIRKRIDAGLGFIHEALAQALVDDLAKDYHILLLTAAFCHHQYGIPDGQMKDMPARAKLAPAEAVLDRLGLLADALAKETPPRSERAFVQASRASTHRIASRRVRFARLAKALACD